jgi:flagellar motor switch protein FliM
VSEILTAEEIAALAAAFAAEGPPRRETVGAVRTIDLASPERSIAGRLPGLELVLGRFARGLRGALATFLGDVPSVSVPSTQLVRFERALGGIGAHAGLVRFRLAPLRGHGLLVVPAPVVATLLQVACGGTAGRTTELPAREFSPIEQRLIERLAQRVLAELRLAWEPVAPVECAYVRTETSPLFATIAATDELVVVAELAVAVPGGPSTTLTIVLPNASLDAIKTSLQALRAADESASPAADAAWGARLRERLLEVPIDVAVELGTTPVTFSRMLALATGDVLPLDTGREGPVVVRVGGAAHFLGAPGVVNGRNAVRVTGTL